MTSLATAGAGEHVTVCRLSGSPEIRRQLTDLGFAPGCEVLVVGAQGEKLVVQIGSCRIALEKSLANRVLL